MSRSNLRGEEMNSKWDPDGPRMKQAGRCVYTADPSHEHTSIHGFSCTALCSEEGGGGRQATGGGASFPQHQHRWKSFASRALLRQDRHAASCQTEGCNRQSCGSSVTHNLVLETLAVAFEMDRFSVSVLNAELCISFSCPLCYTLENMF